MYFKNDISKLSTFSLMLSIMAITIMFTVVIHLGFDQIVNSYFLISLIFSILSLTLVVIDTFKEANNKKITRFIFCINLFVILIFIIFKVAYIVLSKIGGLNI